ncbi:type VI secretion system-associated protein VasI [Xenorhabdus bovienii]|uniref:type VI secretion system-associated protein VasI n=1 Tax=Xenorhabdus bovienii TaxID=40576 RepID=UPI0023B2F9EE|nr:type VI secretion system-associated protein VasI [Xenorhabdus bovienii]MDE9462125.1 type VI secretion system-associated protein TagO [Xenorhabdus bovienii]MDE9470081.1 type VI secretion system-associated protein TagO [Xenorhabdus bovienii]
MNIVLIISSLLASLTGDPKLANLVEPKEVVAPKEEYTDEMQKCRFEPSPLVRLACYDRTVNNLKFNALQIPMENMGLVWRQAMEQEMKRTDYSTGFIVTQGENGEAPVILTTPAVGVPPPRPVLMLSCIDRITRLQVALPKPMGSGTVTVATDKTQFKTEWFLREHGYLWESSRGLSGIEEIKRLMNSDQMTITARTGSPITFNISQLEQAAKPLRDACRW